MQTLEINPDHLRALFAVAPTKEVRTYLNGANIETGAFGAIGVAIDGHCLLAIWLSDAPMPEGWLYAPSAWKLPAGKGPWTLKTTTNAGITTCTLAYESGELRYAGDIGRYPDWRSIVPSSVSLEVSQFSYRVTDKLNKAAKILGSEWGPLFAMNGPDSAALVQFPGAYAFGVAMPIRAEPHNAPPEWFRMPMRAAA